MNIKTAYFLSIIPIPKHNIFYLKKIITCTVFLILSSFAFSQSENIFGTDPRAVLYSYIDSVNYLFARQTDTTFFKDEVLINYKFKLTYRIVKIKFAGSVLTLKLKKNKLHYILNSPNIDFKEEIVFYFKEDKGKLILSKVLVFYNEQKCFVIKNGKSSIIHNFLDSHDKEKFEKVLYNHFNKFKKIITIE